MHATFPTAADRLSSNLATYDRSCAKRRANAERASNLAPAAIAAAQSGQEQTLLTEIFESIPGILDLSSIHDLADIHDNGADLAERRWQKALRQLEAKLTKLINLPAEDAAAAHRRLSLNLQIRKMVELATPISGLEDMLQEDVCVIARAALKTIKSLANPVPTGAERIWSEALDRFLKAEAAHRDPALSDDDWDDATDRAAELESQLHRTPAPTIAALAEKMRLTLKIQLEDHKEDDIDDPRTIAVGLADSDCVVREQVLAYQDALRLAGVRPEIAAATAFDPAPFVAAAEAAGVSMVIGESDDGFSLAPTFLPEDAPADLLSAFKALRQGELALIKSYLHDQRRTSIQ